MGHIVTVSQMFEKSNKSFKNLRNYLNYGAGDNLTRK